MVNRKKAIHILETVYGRYTKSTRKGAPQYNFFSPFVDHHKPKLEVRISKDTIQWSCWISKKGGYGLASLLKASKDETLLDHAYVVDKNVSFKKNDGPSRDQKMETIKMPQDSVPIWKRSPDVMKSYLYLKSRGVTQQMMEIYRLHHSDERGVVFPSYNPNWELRGLFYRLPRADSKMYGDPSNVDHIYFGNTLTPHLPLVVVEGFFDVTSVRGNTTMMGGTYLPVGLCRWASAHDVPVIIYTDGDETGKESEYYSARKLLTYGIQTFTASCPEGTDPGELTSDQNWMYINRAKEIDRFSMMNWTLERK